MIELSTSFNGKYVVLTIKDNGLGLDLNKFRNKIFKTYKTFHYNEDATGIRLPIIKHQIESLGGKVTLGSEVHKGTTLLFY